MGRELTQAIVDGILGGGIYALMAVGLTLIFGVLDIINIAQGILVVLGAYLSYVLSVHLHIDLFVGLLVTVPAMFLIGIAIQWAFIRPLRGRERTSMSLLASYAVAIVIEGILYLVFGANYTNLSASYVTRTSRDGLSAAWGPPRRGSSPARARPARPWTWPARQRSGGRGLRRGPVGSG